MVPAHDGRDAPGNGLHPPAPGARRALGAFAGGGVSVIVPARADGPLVRRAIWSVRATADLPHEVVVRPSAAGVAANRNDCLNHATQDLVAFVDDDVLLPAGWLSGLVEALASDPGIGAVSALLRFADGAPQMRRGDLAAGELWPTTIPGTCFVYSRRRVGDQRFDEAYQASQWEDTDWMWSLHQRGLSTVVTGSVQVVHEHRPRPHPALRHNMAHFHAKWGRLPEPLEVSSIDPRQLERWQRPPLPSAAAGADGAVEVGAP